MMKEALLIAEKPSLRRIIEAVYNKHKSEIPFKITFVEQRGHLLTLKTPDELSDELKKMRWETLPIDPVDYGGWQYKIINDKKVGKYLTSKERYMLIRDELKNGSYDFVINAGDPDQEGQLLIRIVLSSLKNKLPVKRYWSNDTTDEKVLHALKNLKDDDNDPMLKNLLDAAYGRQHSDYRFGMNLSRAATLQMGARVACGRVKTPIMGIVCKRENEIKNFKPSTSYGIKAEYSEHYSGQLFDSSIDETDDGENKENTGLIWFETKKEADDFITKLSSPAKVLQYKSGEVVSYAPKLFKLATVQIAAGKLGLNAMQTLSIIQSLYEKGYVSYPRTDCEYVSSKENFAAMIRSARSVPELAPFIDKIDNTIINKVKATKKWVNDKKLEESGHSALTPTTLVPKFDSLSEEEKKIYTLICRRFIAIFLPPLRQNKVTLITEISGHTFRSNGKTLIDPGFETIFGTTFNDAVIPEHKVGDMIPVEKIALAEKTTVCPKRFTDAALIAVCESPGKYLDDTKLRELGSRLKIGTPATRASIIEELIRKDKYLMRIKEKNTEYIVPTQSGLIIYENLKDCDICKVDLTGVWEEQLEMVRNGSMTLNELEMHMKEHVKKLVLDIKGQKMMQLSSNSRKVIATCPSCGGSIISGPKGFYCSNYKDESIVCKIGAFKMVCESEVSDEEFIKMLNGEEIVKTIKKGSSSWKQKLKYNIETQRIEFVQAEEKKSVYKCPNCSGDILDNGRLMKCAGECGFKFYRTVCGKELNEQQVERFFQTGKTGIIKGLKSKAGKSFSANIALSEDKMSTTFEFEGRHK